LHGTKFRKLSANARTAANICTNKPNAQRPEDGVKEVQGTEEVRTVD